MANNIVFDANLVRRYDRRGPRYTSYPTALQFSDDFTAPQYVEAARESNDDPVPAPLSLYVHLPFCEHACLYCGCTRIITANHAKAGAYLERLYREIELQSALFHRDREVHQVHLGGGTPTFLVPAELRQLMQVLGRNFNLTRAATREYSIEIDPRTVTGGSLAGLRELGFNRISFGVQDLDPRVQKAVNRIQSEAMIRELLQAARAARFDSVNMDLIYGLPLQTRTSFATTLGAIIDMRPDRLAVYSYAHLPQQFKMQRLIDAASLPDFETKLELLGLAVGVLTAAGYEYIGMDHFALPGDALTRALHQGGLQRNFQGYSTGAECDLVGLGMSAIGLVHDTYSQNLKNLQGYYAVLDAGQLAVGRGWVMTADDRVRRAVLQQLTCEGRVSYARHARRFGVNFEGYFAREVRELQPMAGNGVLQFDADGFHLTAAGRLLTRAVAMVFDAYLRPTAPHPQPTPADRAAHFSRVI
ncbi:MAG: oxygen-independent coproporphyrinogen III oxidase [Gammaproteobacteria bacterium]